MHFLKKIITFGIIGAVIYFILSYHYIMNGMDVNLIKKTKPNLKYTLFSLKGKDPEKILRVKELRDVGIGELLVELDIISEEKLEELEEKIDEK